MDYSQLFSVIQDTTNSISESVHATSNVISSVDTFASTNSDVNPNDWAKWIGAGLSMIGAMAVGASQGYAAGSAAQAVGRNPEAQPKILNTMIVGMAITEAVAIYCFIIAILLIFVA